MPEKTQQKKQDDKEKTTAEECEKDDEGNWSRDQREKSYYNDDSYGYEIYNPDEEDDDE